MSAHKTIPVARDKQEDCSRVFNGSVALAGEIFDVHGGFIRAVIASKARDGNRVDDLCQDFFLRLVARPIPADIDPRKMRSYLYKVIVSELVDAFRRIKAYRAHLEKWRNCIYNPQQAIPVETMVRDDRADTAFDLVKRHATSAQVRAITLRYRHGHDTGQVARIMGIDRRTVSRHVTAGLGRVRRVMQKQHG